VLDHVRDLTTANISHFYVIVTVGREVGKAGMAAQRDLLAILNEAVAIDNKLLGKGSIKALVDLMLAVKDAFVFFVDLGKSCKDFFAHDGSFSHAALVEAARVESL
jgi:N-acetylglutamate synthase-like GNAT family acetyltransferase